jgi:hypothetical protein
LKNTPEQRNAVEPYEAPRLVVIGAVREFTFGSGHDQSDNSTTHTGGGHRVAP